MILVPNLAKDAALLVFAEDTPELTIVNKIKELDYAAVKEILPQEEITNFKNNSLSSLVLKPYKVYSSSLTFV